MIARRAVLLSAGAAAVSGRARAATKPLIRIGVLTDMSGLIPTRQGPGPCWCEPLEMGFVSVMQHTAKRRLAITELSNARLPSVGLDPAIVPPDRG